MWQPVLPPKLGEKAHHALAQGSMSGGTSTPKTDVSAITAKGRWIGLASEEQSESDREGGPKSGLRQRVQIHFVGLRHKHRQVSMSPSPERSLGPTHLQQTVTF